MGPPNIYTTEAGNTVPTYKIHDGASEFRVDITGRFAGGCVQDVRTAWQKSLNKTLSRQVVVDLTRVSGFDSEGRKLLREMHQHGTQFAAGTPEALVLLEEISLSPRRGPVLVHDVQSNRKDTEEKAAPLPRSKATSR